MLRREREGAEIWSRFRESGSIALTTHVRPDGDGIASELALLMILETMGKKVTIINQDPTPEIYRWLPEVHRIKVYSRGMEHEIGPFDMGVLLDCSDGTRIGESEKVISRSNVVACIDHHENTRCLGSVNYIDSEASSIGEIIYNLVPDMEQRLNIDIANCLYTSILTDTGSFAHANTTREVFWIASNLVQQGVQPEFVHRKVYREKSYAHFRLLSETLERMKTAEEGKIAYSILPLSVYKKTGANDEDNEGLLDTMRALRGGQLFVLIRQEQNDQGKTSMRSTGSINCSYLAGLFGGGGHARASGFSFIGNVEMEGERIMQRIIEQVKTKAWI